MKLILNTKNLVANAASIVLLFTLVACGGGGGGSLPPPNLPPTGLLNATNAYINNQFLGKVGLPVKFDVSSFTDPDGAIVSYKYQFGDGVTLTQTTNAPISHTYNTAGVYSPSVTVVDNAGGATIGSLVITVGTGNLAPQAKFAVVSTDFTTGKYIEFDPSLSSDYDGTIASHTWDFGDACSYCTSPVGTPVKHYYENAGNYTVKLTVVDNSGASHTFTRSIGITGVSYFNQPPVARIAMDTDPNQAPTVGFPIAFTPDGSFDTDGVIVSYKWDLNDGSALITKASPDPVFVTYATATPRIVKLTVTDDRGAFHTWVYSFNLLTIPRPNLYTSRLNDTGIGTSQCIDTPAIPQQLVSCTSIGATNLNSQQDGMLRKPLSYSKVCNNGQTAGSGTCPASPALGSGANAWGCTLDNVTGLMWEIKTADNLLRDYRTLHLFDPLTDTDSGQVSGAFAINGVWTYPAATKLASKYVSAVNTAGGGLCGFNDWRIPASEELEGLYVYKPTPTTASVDATFFPNTRFKGEFWAATLTQIPSGLSPFSQARVVVYDDLTRRLTSEFGGIDSYIAPLRDRVSASDVRLVRSTLAPYPIRFVERMVGLEPVILDKETNLFWRKCPEGMTWNNATQQCTGTALQLNLRSAFTHAKTQAGWRLPNKNELASTRSRSLDDPTTMNTPFAASNLAVGDWFLTSTPREDGLFGAYVFGFNDSVLRVHVYQSILAPFRLVRDGP